MFIVATFFFFFWNFVIIRAQSFTFDVNDNMRGIPSTYYSQRNWTRLEKKKVLYRNVGAAASGWILWHSMALLRFMLCITSRTSLSHNLKSVVHFAWNQGKKLAQLDVTVGMIFWSWESSLIRWWQKNVITGHTCCHGSNVRNSFHQTLSCFHKYHRIIINILEGPSNFCIPIKFLIYPLLC